MAFDRVVGSKQGKMGCCEAAIGGGVSLGIDETDAVLDRMHLKKKNLADWEILFHLNNTYIQYNVYI